MTRAVGVGSAQFSLDDDGVAHSARFDDVYHSASGAFAQARHVFLRGNALPERWHNRHAFTIVETGFGLGVNFIATWDALRADPYSPAKLHYVSAEQHPPAAVELERYYARNPYCPELNRELIRRWPPLTRGFHRIAFDRGRVVLTLLIGDAAQMLAELDATADALYLDGFAPHKNPAMWSEALVDELARLSVAGTTAATWTVAGVVRVRLAAAGFRVEKRPGFGAKREMLIGEKAGVARRPSPRAGRHAVVVGAGLAGAWCAHALAQRGWQVDLIERHHRPAQAASGNAVGALRPALNLADNDNAQVARAAFLFAARTLADDPRLASTWSQTGVLHVATGAEQRDRMARIDAAHDFPREYVSAIDADEAGDRAGHRVAGPGWWIPLGGWAQPAALCEALLELNRDRIACRFGEEAAGFTHREGAWHVTDRRDSLIAAAQTLILAAGHGIRRLDTVDIAALVPVRGQVTYLPRSRNRSLAAVVCGDGYVAPLPDGGYCVGATFQPDDTDEGLREADHAENLVRLERMLPGFAAGLLPAAVDGRAAVRAATADRLPACGRLNRAADRNAGAEGTYVVTGLGARGLIFAPLCAEVLGAHLDGEPNPIERRLIRALDPARLIARAHGSPLESGA